MSTHALTLADCLRDRRPIVFDTNVLIRLEQGREAASVAFDRIARPFRYVPAAAIIEYALGGARDQRARRLQRLDGWFIRENRIWLVDPARELDSSLARSKFRDFGSGGLADALVVASARALAKRLRRPVAIASENRDDLAQAEHPLVSDFLAD